MSKAAPQRWKIHKGDALAVLKMWPDEFVHCVVTSPPYFGLRSYFDEGAPEKGDEIGLEETPEEHIEKIVGVMREVRRVLRKDGTVWLNYGDCYAGGGNGGGGSFAQDGIRAPKPGTDKNVPGRKGARGVGNNLKPKDLVMMPARVALALQADGAADVKGMSVIEHVIERLTENYERGERLPKWLDRELDKLYGEFAQAKEGSWWLRSEIVWFKNNPMPESITDRPASAHEKIFLLTKSGDTLFWSHRDLPGTRAAPEPDYRWTQKETGEETATEPAGWRAKDSPWKRRNLWVGSNYFYDADAVREANTAGSVERWGEGGTRVSNGKNLNRGGVNGKPTEWGKEQRMNGRNLRNVWEIPTFPYPGAHFATFPPRLVEPCIKAGTSERGVCPECGAPWKRETDHHYTKHRPSGSREADSGRKKLAHGGNGTFGNNLRKHTETTGWSPTCGCGLADDPPPGLPPLRGGRSQNRGPVPGLVLDPFAGSGTTGIVAAQLGRDFIGIDLAGGDKDLGGHTAHDRIEAARRGFSVGETVAVVNGKRIEQIALNMEG